MRLITHFAVKNGQTISIEGELKDNFNITTKGNEESEEWNSFIIAHASDFKERNSEKTDKAIAEFIKANPKNVVSTLLLTCDYTDIRSEEAQKLFDRIEDAREKRENSKFFADFQVAYKKEKELLAGNYDIVEKDMNELCCNISVPYNLVLSYEYLQNKQQISIEVIVEDGINAPNSKAVVLTSGKISIKNKLVRETIQDKSSSALSLAYMVSAHVFNVSPNIEYIRLSLFDRTKQTPLLFVEFNRDVFSHINPKLLALFTDILGYPHVINFKTKGGASEISTWDASHFNQEVMAVCSEKDKERNSVSCEDQEMENGMISISVAQANRLCRFVSDNSDIRHAISLAEDNHADEVVISNKYKGILEEIKNA